MLFNKKENILFTSGIEEKDGLVEDCIINRFSGLDIFQDGAVSPPPSGWTYGPQTMDWIIVVGLSSPWEKLHL